jgi:hypothetical protein
LEIKKNGVNINSDYKKNTNQMIEELFGSYEELTDNNIMLQTSNNFINKILMKFDKKTLMIIIYKILLPILKINYIFMSVISVILFKYNEEDFNKLDIIKNQIILDNQTNESNENTENNINNEEINEYMNDEINENFNDDYNYNSNFTRFINNINTDKNIDVNNPAISELLLSNELKLIDSIRNKKNDQDDNKR